MENSLLIPPSLQNHVSPIVKNELAKMSAENQHSFVHEFNRHAKGTGVAYLFWLLFGLHYAYLGRWGMQIIFWLTGGGFLFWWIIDLFRIPSLVANFNQDVALNALRNIKSIS